jgi:hypothetical protein
LSRITLAKDVDPLRLMQSYRVARESAKAKAAYADFLALWKQADRDMPVMIDAKKEAAEVKD